MAATFGRFVGSSASLFSFNHVVLTNLTSRFRPHVSQLHDHVFELAQAGVKSDGVPKELAARTPHWAASRLGAYLSNDAEDISRGGLAWNPSIGAPVGAFVGELLIQGAKIREQG